MGSWAYISQKYIYFLFKRADHLNITCLSLFTQPHAVSNMPYFYSGSKNWQNVSCYFSQHQFKNVYSMSIHVNVKTPPSVLFFILESVFGFWAMGYKSYDVYFVLGFYFLKSLFTKAEIWISLSAISPLSFPKVLRSWIIPTPHWPVVKLTETAYLGRGLQQLYWPLSKESVFISHSPSNTL